MKGRDAWCPAQGTKACLGWDREPSGGCWACTAVTDAWLHLLTLAFHAARGAPSTAEGTAPDSRRVSDATGMRASNGEAPNGVEASEARRATGDGASARAGERAAAAVASYQAALQQLLSQLLLHWKVI